MNEMTPVDGTQTTVEWRLISPDEVSTPIVRRVPYLELKLEHPDFEPTGHGSRFFPDVVPYELDGARRVFCWRPALAPSSGEPSDWKLVCATTHELTGIDAVPAEGPPLVVADTEGTTLVVDGTVGGETTTSHVTSYSVPDIGIDSPSDSRIEVTVDGTEYSVPTGERRRIRLAEQYVEPVDEDDGPTTVTPELVVRFPGRRELHHPAPRARYRLFPSFDLDLDAVPNPLPIPTIAGELDDAALATELGVDLSQRPYPERVLWQAFVYTAFDPHAGTMPELIQLETGHIVLRTEKLRAE